MNAARYPVVLQMLVIAVTLACAEPIRVPTVAGVVREVAPATGQTDRFVLDTGDMLLDIARDEGVYPPGGGSPRIGDLLIVGMKGGSTWYMVVPRVADNAAGRPCFQLSVTGIDRGTVIDTSLGVSLPKTPDFDPGPDTNGIYEEQPHSFCLDERGHIYRWV
jgi:hypothetical protein